MLCPKCGFEQPQADECRLCGIVIEKFISKPVHPPVVSQQITSSEHVLSSSMAIKMVAVYLITFLLAVYAGLSWWKSRPVVRFTGEIVSGLPEQAETQADAFNFKGHRIIPLADFDITARVLSKTKYYFGRESDLAPFDLALGWGKMAKGAVLEKIKIRQSNRFYFWSAEQFPIPRKQIETHSANMHLIPSDKSVLNKIKAVRAGDFVSFSGYLVKVTGSDGWRWKSSLSRSDSGKGACELIFVNEFEIK